MACPMKKHMNGTAPINGSGDVAKNGKSNAKLAALGDSLSWTPPNLPPQCKWALDKKQESPHNHYRNEDNRRKAYSSVLEAIGNTPMVRLSRLEEEYGLECELYAKCEFFNAGGSIKDRIALRMIEEAERTGRIRPNDGYTIIEPTSGNTGIGLALSAAVKGYRCIIVLPEKMSLEKVNVLKALGAEIVRTRTSAAFDDLDSHVRIAQKLEQEIPKAVILDQYRNPGNPMAHYDTTAAEMLEQLGGQIDAAVMGAGTGGTISGIGRKLKEKCPSCQMIGVDPEGSDLALPVELNKTNTTFYEVEGIGYDFIPSVLDRSVVDKWYKSNDKDSFLMARKLIRVEGLLCGGSSGGAAAIAVEHAKTMKKGQKVVMVLADSIRNYMTKHLMTDWMIEHEFLPLPEEASKKWWAVKTVADMDPTPPMSVKEDNSVDSTFKLMTEMSYDQLPVLTPEGKLTGVVTMSDMAIKLATGTITSKSNVSAAMCKEFKTIKTTTNLWVVSKMFDKVKFMVVTGKDTKYDLLSEGEVTNVNMANTGEGSLCGIISASDFYLFLSTKMAV